MSAEDEWMPGPCEHGARPIIEQEYIELGLAGTFRDLTPGPKTLRYECPTPYECAHAAYEELRSL
jgi:hypothetical protein